MSLRIGVLAVQGAVSEHADALRRAGQAVGQDVEVVTVRRPEDLEGVAGLVIPGGESTTISRLLRSTGLQPTVTKRARDGDLAVFGTCAGLVLISSRASHDVQEKDVHQLGLLDAEVDRNAFGRQRESFETTLDIEGIGPMPCVFIRAPALEEVGPGVEVLARFKDRIVAARKGNVLGAAFHPELTPDTRLHEMFIGMVRQAAGKA